MTRCEIGCIVFGSNDLGAIFSGIYFSQPDACGRVRLGTQCLGALLVLGHIGDLDLDYVDCYGWRPACQGHVQAHVAVDGLHDDHCGIRHRFRDFFRSAFPEYGSA